MKVERFGKMIVLAPKGVADIVAAEKAKIN